MCWDQNPARKPTIDDYIRHLEYIVDLAGIERVAFGTDLATGTDYRRMAFERSHWRRWEGINRFNCVFGDKFRHAIWPIATSTPICPK